MAEKDEYPEVLDAAQVADLLSLSLDYVRKLSREGVLPAHRLGPQGRTFRYLKDEVLDWLRSQPVGDAGSDDRRWTPSQQPASRGDEAGSTGADPHQRGER